MKLGNYIRKSTLVGRKFGRLRAGEIVGKNKYRQSLYQCHCVCGNDVIVPRNRLITGNTKSCGCLSRDMARTRRTTHGRRYTRLWATWNSMLKRCLYPTQQNYKYYGGRGISVYSDWYKAENFFRWALTHGYRDDLQIDRINPDGNYEPKNCRFITGAENKARTKRRIPCLV